MQCCIEGALSDLHAVEARYHKDCMSLYFSSINHKHSASTTQLEIDTGLEHLLKVMSADKSRIWNSLELYMEYQSNHGCVITRKHLIIKLKAHLQQELVILSSPGYASIVAFHCYAAVVLKMVKDDVEDDIGSFIGKLAKKVVNDCKEISFDTSIFKLHIDEHTATAASSSTILTLLATLSPKLNTPHTTSLIVSQAKHSSHY